MSLAFARTDGIATVEGTMWAGSGGPACLSLGQQFLTRIPIPAERGCARKLLDRGHNQTLVTKSRRSCAGCVELCGNLWCYAAVEASRGQSDPGT